MILHKQIVAFLGLLLVLVSPTSVHAQSYLKCLEQSRGKVLNWQTSWGSDNADRGMKYQVKRVEVVNKIPDRIVTLTLQATEARANKKTRQITVKTEERARPLCEELTVVKRLIGLPGSGIASQPPEYKLPFIKYTKDGWVRAKRPERVLDLSVCRVLKREFSCLSDEKERWGTWLKTVEEEIRWSGVS